MSAYSTEKFEDDIAEGTKLFYEKAVKGLNECEKWDLRAPRFPFPELQFQGLGHLDKTLMEWARSDASAKNHGYSIWHAKYLAACCFLLHNRKEAHIPTTTRTIRCAVVMINQVLSNLYQHWGDNAFSLWPALAVKSYILASVGRHAEQVRRAIVPRVTDELLEAQHRPELFDHHFNPVKLLAALIDSSEQEVANALYLPYLPEKSGWSWADLGMDGIHEYACRRGSGLNWSVSEDLMHPSLPPLVNTDSLTISPPAGPYSRAASSSYLSDSLSSRYLDLPFNPEVPLLPVTTRMPSEIIAQTHLGSHGNIQPQPYRLKRETSSVSDPRSADLGSHGHIQPQPYRLKRETSSVSDARYGDLGSITSGGRQPNDMDYLESSEQWLPERATSDGLLNTYSSRSSKGYSQATLGSDTGGLKDSWLNAYQDDPDGGVPPSSRTIDPRSWRFR